MLVTNDAAVDLQAVAEVLRWFLARFRHYHRWANGVAQRSSRGPHTHESNSGPDEAATHVDRAGSISTVSAQPTDPSSTAVHAAEAEAATPEVDPILAAMFGRYEGIDQERADYIAHLLSSFLKLHESWFIEPIQKNTDRGTSLTRRDFYLWLLFRRLSRVFEMEKLAGGPLPHLRRGVFVQTGVPYTPEVRDVVEAYAEHLEPVPAPAPRAAAQQLIGRLAGCAPWFARSEHTLRNVHLFVHKKHPALFSSAPIDWTLEFGEPSSDEGWRPNVLDPAADAETLIDALTASDIDDRSTSKELLGFFAHNVLGYDEPTSRAIVRAATGEEPSWRSRRGVVRRRSRHRRS